MRRYYMKVSVSSDYCVGCGYCAAVCPEVFQLRDDGCAVATGKMVNSLKELVSEIVESCPVTAIEVEM
jgi:ferredoxin